MRVIQLTETDIEDFMESLDYEKLKLLVAQKGCGEGERFIKAMYRAFHFRIVKFFQDQGSTFPCE